MEVSALKQAGSAGIHGTSPLLRLQSDERLIALIRRGNHAAFEAMVKRYQSRLLAFCRHMLGSKEDAEDVLQEVFTAAFNAILADQREINVRPWLYRIARNRSLNHLRRVQAIGVDSMDIHLSDSGMTTADKVHRREDFRLLLSDVGELPETQRTALLLREIDALSYDQIAEAMETTIPSVKSLLVRARVSLAEAAEARLMSCAEVRLELGEVAEGLKRLGAPARRHVRGCERCTAFRTQLRATNKALAAVLPIGPLLLFKKLFLAHLGTTTAAGGAASAGGTAAGAGATAGAGGLLGMGASTLASKTAAGLAAAAIVTAGAVEVREVTDNKATDRRVVAFAPPAPAPSATPATPTPQLAAPGPSPVLTSPPALNAKPEAADAAKDKPADAETSKEGEGDAAATTATTPTTPTTTTIPAPTTPTSTAPPAPPPPGPQTDSGTTVLPQDDGATTTLAPPPETASAQAPPSPPPPAPAPSPPAASPAPAPAPAPAAPSPPPQAEAAPPTTGG